MRFQFSWYQYDKALHAELFVLFVRCAASTPKTIGNERWKCAAVESTELLILLYYSEIAQSGK